MSPSTPGPPVESVRSQQERLVTLARDLLGIDTSTPHGHTREIVDQLEMRFAELGLSTVRYAVDPTKPDITAALSEEDDRVLCLDTRNRATSVCVLNVTFRLPEPRT